MFEAEKIDGEALSSKRNHHIHQNRMIFTGSETNGFICTVTTTISPGHITVFHSGITHRV